MVTPAVRKFASQFTITGEVASLIPIIRKISSFRPVFVSPGQLKQLYAKRTASDIISSGTVVLLGKADRAKYKDVRGCIDYSIALLATLRALGIKASFVRAFTGSEVFFEFRGKNYFIIPGLENSRPLEINATQESHFNRLRAIGKRGIGKDAWAIGIKSIADFSKYE